MADTWEDLLATLHDCPARVRLRSGTWPAPWVLEGHIRLEDGVPYFEVGTAPSPSLPPRGLAELTIYGAPGVVHGTCVMVQQHGRAMRILASGAVRVEQRRQHPRLSVECPIVLELKAGLGGETRAVLQDISSGGASVDTGAPLVPGELIYMKLTHTPTGDMRLMAQVRTSGQHGYITRAGVQWIRMSDAEREGLKALLLATIAGQWPTPELRAQPAIPQYDHRLDWLE